MDLPADYVISSTLSIGVVYKFSAPELLSTDEPHYFIVVAIEEEINFLCLCTTQLQNKIDFLKKKRYSLDTLAYIEPTENNGLSKDTYINCNDYYNISISGLITKVESGNFSCVGNLTKEEYEKIVTAISISTVNDIPKYLLKFP